MTENKPTAKLDIKRLLGLILGSLLSVLSLVLVVRGLDLSQIVEALRATSPVYFGLALLSYALSMWAKAHRWRLLFYPRPSMRLGKLASVLLIGQMANVWLFTRSGELARAYLIGRIEDTNKAGALGTIVLEKSLESLMILSSLGLLALFMPLPGRLQAPGILLSAGLVGLLLALLMAARQRARIVSWGERLIKRVPRLQAWDLSRRLIDASNSLEGLGRGDITFKLVAWSVLIWGISALTNYYCLRAVGISTFWYVSLFLLVVFYVGASLPASPGRLGVFHYLAVQGLAIFGVGREVALAFAIVLHFIAYVLMGLAGAICLWRENLALQREEGAR